MAGIEMFILGECEAWGRLHPIVERGTPAHAQGSDDTMSKTANELIVARGGLQLPDGAGAGKVGTSDAAGNHSWTTPVDSIRSTPPQ